MGIVEMTWESWQARTLGQRPPHVLAVSLGVSGLVMFLLLAYIRAQWWYFDSYPWVDTWRQMLWIVLISLLGILVVGLLAFWAVFKLLPRVLTRRKRLNPVHCRYLKAALIRPSYRSPSSSPFRIHNSIIIVPVPCGINTPTSMKFPFRLTARLLLDG